MNCTAFTYYVTLMAKPAAHAFDYIAFRINPGLTSCKELATVMDISLDNDHSSCNASYVLPCRCMFGIVNLLLP